MGHKVENRGSCACQQAVVAVTFVGARKQCRKQGAPDRKHSHQTQLTECTGGGSQERGLFTHLSGGSRSSAVGRKSSVEISREKKITCVRPAWKASSCILGRAVVLAVMWVAGWVVVWTVVWTAVWTVVLASVWSDARWDLS